MGNDTAERLRAARFWSKVDVRRPGECWEWRSARKDNGGYGVFNATGSRTVRANRFAFEIVNRRLEPGEVVRHTCDNPPCCNPFHLVAGTQAENVAEMHEKGRRKYVTRLTPDDRLEIYRRCSRGETQSNVARLFGISQAYVSKIYNERKSGNV